MRRRVLFFLVALNLGLAGFLTVRHAVADRRLNERAAEIERVARTLEVERRVDPGGRSRVEALRWLRSAPLGLLVHYGPGSSLAAPDDAAWWRTIQSRRGRDAAADFRANPAAVTSWVAAAKAVGASYLVVTAKHHDGYDLWSSGLTSWDVNRSHDVLRRLAAATRRAHLRLFVYYSLLDWHEPTYDRDQDAYARFVAGQIRELLTGYGPVAGVWFDGSWAGGLDDRRLEQIYGLVHSLQPWALVGSNSHARPLPGEDFQIFESGFPGARFGGRPVPVARSLPHQAVFKAGRTWFWDGRREPVAAARVDRLLREARRRSTSLLLSLAAEPDGRIAPVVVRALRRAAEPTAGLR